MGEFHLTPDERVIVFYAKEYETSDHKVSGLLDHISVNKYSLEKNQSYDTIITDAKELSIGFLFEKAYDTFPFFNEYEETDMDEEGSSSFFNDKFINFIKSTLENNNIEKLNIDLLTCHLCWTDNKYDLADLINDNRVNIRYTDNHLGYQYNSYNWELDKYNSHLNLDQRLNLIGLYFNSNVVDWKDHLSNTSKNFIFTYQNNSSRTVTPTATVDSTWGINNIGGNSNQTRNTVTKIEFPKTLSNFTVNFTKGQGLFEDFDELTEIEFQTLGSGYEYNIGREAFAFNSK